MSRARLSNFYVGMIAAFSLASGPLFCSVAHADDGDGSWLPRGVSLSGFLRTEIAVKTSDAQNQNNQYGNPYNGQADNPLNPGAIRPVPSDSPLFNLHILRAEGVFNWHIMNGLLLSGRLRGIGDVGDYNNFNAGNLDQYQGGINGGDPALYGGSPNLFQYRVENGSGKVDSHPNPLEWDGPRYQVYFPALFLDYSHGPLDIRVGEQSIAWGNAIFFRVFDTANGIDFRRHSVLDYEQEEYSDKRVPAPAIRVDYQVNDALLLDGYAEKFQPTVYGNPNTPYNVIPSQFTVHDQYGDYEDKLNYAIRAVANIGNWSVEGFAGRRYNPDGAFRWTKSDVNKDLLGAPGSGTVLANSPFEVAPGSVYSAAEWFHYAAMTRLNGVASLNSAINDFQPATGLLGAAPVPTFAQATGELNTFFAAAGGGLRGHLARDYFQEYNFGIGAGYTTQGAPGSLLDQLLIHMEIRYTPDRTFTSPDLNTAFLRQNDWVGALTLEKYYRFADAVPATYIVLQYMHRTRSDLFGRSLEGYGGTDTSVPHGVSGANYIVLALQQPMPLDIIRFGFAALYDPRGGILVQPGVQWKVNNHLSIDGFYNYINAHLSGNPNNNLLGGTEYGNEVTMRIGYQF